MICLASLPQVFCIPPGLLSGQPGAWSSCLLSVVPAPGAAYLLLCCQTFAWSLPSFICPLVLPGNKRSKSQQIKFCNSGCIHLYILFVNPVKEAMGEHSNLGTEFVGITLPWSKGKYLFCDCSIRFFSSSC